MRISNGSYKDTENKEEGVEVSGTGSDLITTLVVGEDGA